MAETTPTIDIGFSPNYQGNNKSCAIYGSGTKGYRNLIKDLASGSSGRTVRFMPNLREFNKPGWLVPIDVCDEARNLYERISRGEETPLPDDAPTSSRSSYKKKTQPRPMPELSEDGGEIPVLSKSGEATATTQTVVVTVQRPRIGQTVTLDFGDRVVTRKVVSLEENRGIVERVYIAEESKTDEQSMLFIGNRQWMLWGSFAPVTITFA